MDDCLQTPPFCLFLHFVAYNIQSILAYFILTSKNLFRFITWVLNNDQMLIVVSTTVTSKKKLLPNMVSLMTVEK